MLITPSKESHSESTVCFFYPQKTQFLRDHSYNKTSQMVLVVDGVYSFPFCLVDLALSDPRDVLTMCKSDRDQGYKSYINENLRRDLVRRPAFQRRDCFVSILLAVYKKAASQYLPK